MLRRSMLFAPRSPEAHRDDLAALRQQMRSGGVCLVVVPELVALDRDPARVMALLHECEEWDVRVLVLQGHLQHLPMRWLVAYLRERIAAGLAVDD